ncbi:hypothetical protein BJX96DRAFT_185114 [Aspergillus floccosus]
MKKIVDDFLKLLGVRDSRRLSFSHYAHRGNRHDHHWGPSNLEKRGRSTTFLDTPDGLETPEPISLGFTSPHSPQTASPRPLVDTLDLPLPDLDCFSDTWPSTDASHHGPSKDISATSPSSGESKEPQEHPEHPDQQHSQQTQLLSPGPETLDAEFRAELAEVVALLINQQRNASAQRSHVRELRTALRHKRDEEAELRAELMKTLLPLFTANGPGSFNPTENVALVEEYDLLQKATEEYLDLEYTYHQAEDQLGEQEYMLARSMERFIRFTQGEKDAVLQESLASGPVAREIIHDDASSYDSAPRNIPAGLRAYLSRVGDVQILQERLSDLDAHYASIMGKQEQRNVFHIPLDEESWEFLQTFEKEWTETFKDLNQAQWDAKDLEAICAEAGVLTDEYKNTLDYVYQFDIVYQISVMNNGENLFHDVEIPLKLPAEPAEQQDQLVFFEGLPAELDASLSGEFKAPKMDKATFVNRWVWHQLSISRIEIRRLEAWYSIYGVWEEGYDYGTIGELAQTEWFKDKRATSAKSISEVDALSNDAPEVLDPASRLLGQHRTTTESKGSLQPFFEREIRRNTAHLSLSHGSLG